MPQIIVLPHHEICPEGAAIEAESGQSICEALLKNDLDIEHACEMSCACTTCHVIVREGFESLNEADELEEDYLDKPGVWSPSRACLARLWWAMTASLWRYRATRSIMRRRSTELLVFLVMTGCCKARILRARQPWWL
jgi:2Fe-2S type ferredoxin (ISC system)